MDVIGSVSAVLGIAEVGISTSFKLLSFAGQVKSSPSTITGIAQDTSLTVNMLQQLGELMKQQVPACGSFNGELSGDKAGASNGIFNKEGLQTAQELASRSEDIFHRIDQELKKASKQISRKGLNRGEPIKLSAAEKLKWPFFQPRIEEIRAELKDVKASLTFLLQITTLSYSRSVAERQNSKGSNANIILLSPDEEVVLSRSILAAYKENAAKGTGVGLGDGDVTILNVKPTESKNIDRGPPPKYDSQDVGTSNIQGHSGDPVSSSSTAKLEAWTLYPTVTVSASNNHSLDHNLSRCPIQEEIIQQQLPKWKSEARDSLWSQWTKLSNNEQEVISALGSQIDWIHIEEPRPFIIGLPEVKGRTVYFVVRNTATFDTIVSTSESPPQTRLGKLQSHHETTLRTISAPVQETVVEEISYQTAELPQKSIQRHHSAETYAVGDTWDATESSDIDTEEPDEDWEERKMVDDLVAKYTNVNKSHDI
ncbi:hypothetical protein BGW36DRAFT_458939 [Talaromyces proteolyticus]|uniref:Fungal N-terminal domain-containing protein n=1 Tax=Talaromyces proteolyticus TaxID=1131652 RepID=A0AAD4L1K2_9EURO|nr:uncharacterized protein BGW36DRAFT_458939 [Talaromyces proteolyticus]KAH8702180.1 hypothetical protein BGW36DRAFT_458939 [Talaromyces proteolyticus]